MKPFYCLLFLFPSFAYSQMEIPEPSEIKTEYRTSFFQANYVVQRAMFRLLQEDHELIANESRVLEVEARDLYYEKSSHYKKESEIRYDVKNKYLTTEKEKMARLDSILHIDAKWLNQIKEDGLVDELINRLHFGWVFKVRGNRIYSSPAPGSCSRDCSVYHYDFNENKRLLAKKLGRINSFKDTLFWFTTDYEYNENELTKAVQKKCDAVDCRKGTVVETKMYVKGQLTINLVQKYSRHDNQLIKEDYTTYYHTGEILDSTISITYYQNKGEREFYEAKTTEYKFDEQQRLASTICSTVNKEEKVTEVYTEEFEYLENQYLYRYIESFKKENGKEKLPLQYELSLSFK